MSNNYRVTAFVVETKKGWCAEVAFGTEGVGLISTYTADFDRAGDDDDWRRAGYASALGYVRGVLAVLEGIAEDEGEKLTLGDSETVRLARLVRGEG